MKVAGKFVFVSTSIILIVLHLSVWIQDNHAFAVKNVFVYGNSLLTKSEIIKAARVDRQSHILKADLQAIRARLESVPEIKSVRVARILPSSLRIEVVERKPIALIIDNGIWGIDSEGYILPRFHAEHGLDYPVIAGFRLEQYLPGKKISNGRVMALVNFLRELKQTTPAVYHMISEITSNDLVGIKILTVHDNLPIFLGKTRLLQKCSNLEVAYNFLVAEKKIRQIRYLDLRFNDQIVAKKKA